MSTIRGFVVLCVLGFFGYLFIQARKGDVTSIAILSAGVAILLVFIGVGIAVLVQYTTAKRDNARFVQNMQENLAIMGAMQKVQNQQNAMLLKQASHKALSPGESMDLDSLVFDDAVFSELEE